MRQGGNPYAYLYDGTGNVETILNNQQQVAAAYRYDPFGVLLNQTAFEVQPGLFIALDQPYGFSTKRYDPQIGMIQYEYRNYFPAIGRWGTRDPLGEAGGMNLYAFVGNNPVNWIDPWGLFDDLSQWYNYMTHHGTAGLPPLDQVFMSPTDNIYWQLRRKYPPGPLRRNTNSFYGGGEVHLARGGGAVVVVCSDEMNRTRRFLYRKDCIGLAVSASATVYGVTRGMDGENCDPYRYEGVFAEFGMGIVGIDVGLAEKPGFSGVFGAGVCVGAGFKLSLCEYTYVPLNSQ